MFDADDPPAFRSPPPPDDRLWRHPSELGWAVGPTRRRSLWPVAAVSGITGAVLTVGLLAVTGTIGGRVTRPEIVVQEARPTLATIGTTTSSADVVRIAGVVSRAIVVLEIDGESPGVGSGVLFRTDGHLLTNAHVVEGAEGIEAVLADGRTMAAHVVGADADTDIAVVKLDADGPFPTAVLGTADGMAVGQPAIAVGVSVSAGVVSAVGREVRRAGKPTLLDMIQTDAAIDVRSSGGALVDGDGTVVGITTAWPGSSPLGLATPVDVARAVADDLLDMGRVRPVWFGVKGSTDPDGGGVVVAEVLTDGPAIEAGIRAGDLIRRIDGHPVASMSALRMALRRRHPGDPITVVFDRSGTRHTAVAVLAERPTSAFSSRSGPQRVPDRDEKGEG